MGSQSVGLSVFVNELHKGQTFLTGISCNRIGGAYLEVYRRREEQRLEKGEEREDKARGGDSLTVQEGRHGYRRRSRLPKP